MERLQKVMAQAGVASRRKSEELILAGFVTVNGEVVKELGTKVSTSDVVEVKGVPLAKEEPVYYLFYKPRGVISAVTDDKKRPVVVDYFPQVKERIFPVGRLDYDTSGLLLLTNDGDFAQKLLHPSFEIEKTYVAKLKGVPTYKELRPLERGMRIDNYKLQPAKVNILSTDEEKGHAIVALTIHEGRNHQVKKMFEAVGFPVQKLKRELYGNLTLAGLRPGEYRRLNKKEVTSLLQLAKKKD
ncbi:pseudouridine synthase [Enterococcus nangangensis]|uniref:pseudouridine synthase n=1 Tax=Enterococcus nangangensis TaxID=2559926 RepID=UPI0010F98882|nr:pseudouridine synthase [Enterococcus nangangensis]